MGAAVEGGKIVVVGGLRGVKLINEVIIVIQSHEAFLLQIGFGAKLILISITQNACFRNFSLAIFK